MENTDKNCKGCICASCINTMWDGGLDDCFNCEFCINGDRAKRSEKDCKNLNQ